MLTRKRHFFACHAGYMMRLVVVSMAFLFAAAPGHAQDLFAGNIKAIDSNDPAAAVKIIRTGYSGILSGKPGDAVFSGDTLKTDAGVKAQIELADSTVIILGPHSSTQIKGFQVDRSEAKRNAVLKALKGTIRYIVAKLFKPHPAAAEMTWKESSFVVETTTCVAGVRGTDFVVTPKHDSTEIAVFDGAVSMMGSLPPLRGEVIVGSNQISIVNKGEVPSQPVLLSLAKVNALLDATTLKNPRTLSGGNDNAVKKANAKVYTSKDLRHDLVSGIPLGDAMDRAVENGMPIEDVVSAAITDAGVNAGTVVYTAMIEGYPPNLVVESAIKSGAPLDVVVSMALSGGGEKRLIILGAQDAGVPPSAIANSFANNGTPTAPITGGGGMIGSTPPLVIPAPPTPIGGGGGAPPSTRKASPYRP